MTNARSQWTVAIASVAAFLLLIAGISQVAWPWIVDDAYISLRFAERFAHGEGLTWTDGERVEGYSNLLWLLLAAGFEVVGLDGVTAVRVLGVVCTTATFVVLLGSRLLPRSWPAPLAVAVLASLSATATWTTGGLESPLMMLLVVIAMANVVAAVDGDAHRARRHLLAAGCALGLAVLTRPDGPLWAAVVAIVVLFARREPTAGGASLPRQLVWLLAIPIATALAHLAFRLAYYGDWVPNPAHAKVAVSRASIASGFEYATSAAIAMRALLLPAVIGIVRVADRASRPAVLLAAIGASAWWLYIVMVGGDNFPRSRLLVPSLGPLTVLAAHGFAAIGAFGRTGRVIAWVVALGCIGLASADARRPTDDKRQQLTEWEWLGKATGEWLGRAFASQQPLLAVDAAGAVPYFSRLPGLDMLGLCDRTIATTPFPTNEAFIAGHNRANGAYVLSREPDLVLFGLPPGAPQPQWLGGRQIEQDPRFLAGYRVLLFETGPVELPAGPYPNLRITVWARLAGKLGPHASTTSPRHVVVPAYWLGSYRQPYSFTAPPASVSPVQRVQDLQAGADWWLAASVAGVHRDGAEWPLAEVRRAGHHSLTRVPVPPGSYRALATGLPDGVTVTITGGDDGFVDLTCDVAPWVALPVLLDRFVLERAG